MQISQFVIGIVFASMHFLVKYSVPVSTPHTWTETVSSAVSAASSAVAGSVTEAIDHPQQVGTFLKQLILRGIGEPALAKKLGQQINSTIASPSTANFTQTFNQVTEWRTQYEYVPCIDTEGEAFAIWLNIVYLAPLT
jgi:hypothetical protein